MSKIKIAIAGVGNCASSLIQGIYYYSDKSETDVIGLMHWDLGGYLPGDIEVVAAFDVDRRKVGRDVNEAIFAAPNCTTVFCGEVPASGVTVSMGCILDGVADHMEDYKEERTFLLSDAPESDHESVLRILRESGAEILLNYLPVGSEEASRFYAECALEAGVAFINNIPVFIASDPAWAARFEERLSVPTSSIPAVIQTSSTCSTVDDWHLKRNPRRKPCSRSPRGGSTTITSTSDRATTCHGRTTTRFVFCALKENFSAMCP
jgi:myo-inositol-1-phosphate synthase